MRIISSILPCAGAALFAVGCADPYLLDPVSHHSHPPGHVLRTLPPGHRTEVVGGTRYYLHGGTYYRPRGSSYVVVRSPHRHPGYDDRRHYDYRDGRRVSYGTVVRTLPSGCRVVTHRGNRYYRGPHNYYQRRGNGYIVVRAPF